MNLDINQLRETFSNRLAFCRKTKDLTQQELSDVLNTKYPDAGFSKSTISNQEQARNNPTFYQIHIYSSFFDVSTDFILGVSNLAKMPTVDEITVAVKTAIVSTTSDDKREIAKKVLELLDIEEIHLSESDKKFLSININRAVNKLLYEQLLL